MKIQKLAWFWPALFPAITVLLRGLTIRAFRLAPVFCGAVLTGIATATPIQTVFDNTVAPGIPGGGPSCCRVGDEITLAGTFRRIVNISLAVSTQNLDWLAPIEMRIYANDGPAGAPGSVLWDSGTNVFLVHAADTFIHFSVPGVLVPDTITVTSWIQGRNGLGKLHPTGTALGTFVAAWVHEDQPGATWLVNPPIFAFEIRVDAVDEPGTGVLTILAVALLFWFARSTQLSRTPAFSRSSVC